jgi:hypothetical protein
VLLLSYANNSRHQKIYLRQGEDADYLMHPNDPISSGGYNNPYGRPAARQFAPYNLTVTNLDARADERGGKFVDFPTQAGAFFQWAATRLDLNGGMRWAWNPHSSTVSNWNVGFHSNFYWDAISGEQEVSPVGWRRPNDGSISAIEPCTSVANSELRQSLYYSPGAGINYNSNLVNSVWGYYADGFFDRRQIVTALGDNGAANSAVSVGNSSVAYVGRLFFNPIINSERTNASIFFPATGNRNHVNGILQWAGGSDASYWTSSSYSTTEALALRLNSSTHAGIWINQKAFGFCIRPVRE